MRRVDHTAIVVRDLDDALGRYKLLFDPTGVERVLMPDQAVEVAFLAIGDTSLELITPIEDKSGVARFLQSRGEGLHHVGIAVDDLERELARMSHAGIELIDKVPRQGMHGRIAFVHPRATGGILLELVEAHSST